MQTFLPYPDFARTAGVLDDARLGKQRLETLQILRALTLPEYGWARHPAVRMWCGCTKALVVYGTTGVRAWVRRGHADATLPLIAEFAPEAADQDQQTLADGGALPAWLGDERLHRSHRSALVRKDPGHYRALFPDVPDDLPYWWPGPGAPCEQPTAVRGSTLWVVRPRGVAALGTFLEQGVIALGPASGIAVDASGCDTAGLHRLLARTAPGRRAGKDLRQLDAFVNRMTTDDRVGVLIERGATLLLGDVIGGYRYEQPHGRDIGLCHRRAVRWHSRLPRSAVTPPAALQDPRTLFQVRLRPGS